MEVPRERTKENIREETMEVLLLTKEYRFYYNLYRSMYVCRFRHTHTCIHKTKASTACLFPFSAISHQNLRAQLLQFANCKAKHGHDAPKFKTITWNLKSITWKLICYHYNYNILIRASFGSFHVINSYTYGEMSTLLRGS